MPWKSKKEAEKDANLQMESIRFFSKEDESRNIWLQFTDFTDYQKKETRLVSIMRKYPGNGSVFFYLKNTKQVKQGAVSVGIDETCLDELAKICGKDNLRIK